MTASVVPFQLQLILILLFGLFGFALPYLPAHGSDSKCCLDLQNFKLLAEPSRPIPKELLCSTGYSKLDSPKYPSKLGEKKINTQCYRFITNKLVDLIPDLPLAAISTKKKSGMRQKSVITSVFENIDQKKVVGHFLQQFASTGKLGLAFNSCPLKPGGDFYDILENLTSNYPPFLFRPEPPTLEELTLLELPDSFKNDCQKKIEPERFANEDEHYDFSREVEHLSGFMKDGELLFIGNGMAMYQKALEAKYGKHSGAHSLQISRDLLSYAKEKPERHSKKPTEEKMKAYLEENFRGYLNQKVKRPLFLVDTFSRSAGDDYNDRNSLQVLVKTVRNFLIDNGVSKDEAMKLVVPVGIPENINRFYHQGMSKKITPTDGPYEWVTPTGEKQSLEFGEIQKRILAGNSVTNYQEYLEHLNSPAVTKGTPPYIHLPLMGGLKFYDSKFPAWHMPPDRKFVKITEDGVILRKGDSLSSFLASTLNDGNKEGALNSIKYVMEGRLNHLCYLLQIQGMFRK